MLEEGVAIVGIVVVGVVVVGVVIVGIIVVGIVVVGVGCTTNLGEYRGQEESVCTFRCTAMSQNICVEFVHALQNHHPLV